MSENIFEQSSELPVPDEKQVLLERAKTLGLKVSGNIGVDTLRQKIEDHLTGTPSNDDEEEETFNEPTDEALGVQSRSEDEEDLEEEQEKEVVEQPKTPNLKPEHVLQTSVKPKTAEKVIPKNESIAEKVRRLRKESLKLIRVRVTCMNPAKKDVTGEFITIANKYIGKVSKFVPFGLEAPYHLPLVIVNELKRRRYTHVASKTRDGVMVTQPEAMRDVPEYNIEILDPLTQAELDDLRIQQAQSGSLNAE